MDEIWKAVVGYEGLYEVSSEGRVRSLDRVVDRVLSSGEVQKKRLKGRLLKQSADRRGYMYVFPCVGGTATRLYLHRAVATAFLPPAHTTETVNHKDFNPKNNKCENLEWMTQAENMGHAVAAGRLSPTVCPRTAKKLTVELVDAIRSRYAAGENVNSLAAEFSVTSGTVSKIGQGRSWVRPDGSTPKLPSRVLTREQRLEVGRLKLCGVPVKALRARFGITQAHMGNCQKLFISTLPPEQQRLVVLRPGQPGLQHSVLVQLGLEHLGPRKPRELLPRHS